MDDINPDHTNKLIVHSKVMNDIILIDDKLINRFGEHKEEVEAVKYVTKKVTEETSTESGEETSTPKTREVTEEIPCSTREEVENFASLYLE